MSKFLAERSPAEHSVEQAVPAQASSSISSGLVEALGIVARTSKDPYVPGIEVLDVNDDGPAQDADLRPAYVINTIDGKHVKTVSELLVELKSRPPNSPVRIGYIFHTNLGWMGNTRVVTLLPVESPR